MPPTAFKTLKFTSILWYDKRFLFCPHTFYDRLIAQPI